MKQMPVAALIFALGAAPTVASEGATSSPPAARSAFAALIGKASPAVVGIIAHRAVPLPEPNLRVAPFSRFFSGLPGQDPSLVRGLGAGFIVNGRLGYVVTTSQIADAAPAVLVQLGDGRQVEAKKLGRDLVSSVAVLQVAAENLPELPLNPRAAAQIGDPVLALGRDAMRGLVATSGIVSGLPSPGHDQDALAGLLETDAAMIDENAGGPLVGPEGEVLGLNIVAATPLLAHRRAVGYAIPAEKVLAAMKQLVAFGAIRHAALQLTVRDLDPETAKTRGFGLDAGALVLEVPASSPAERAGIRPGDVIAAVDDEPVANAGQLNRRIWELPANTTVTLTIVRKADSDRFKAIVATTDRTAEAVPSGSMGAIRIAEDPQHP